VLQESFEWFETQWGVLDTRLHLIPGKGILSALNRHLQQEHHINLTHATIMAAMMQREVPADLREILEAFEDFAGP
jgi:hypothetical protein